MFYLLSFYVTEIKSYQPSQTVEPKVERYTSIRRVVICQTTCIIVKRCVAFIWSPSYGTVPTRQQLRRETHTIHRRFNRRQPRGIAKPGNCQFPPFSAPRAFFLFTVRTHGAWERVDYESDVTGWSQILWAMIPKVSEYFSKLRAFEE